MRVGLVDDTKQVGKREGMGKLIALGAVVLDETHLRCFDLGVRDRFRALGVPDNEELKWSAVKDTFFRSDEGRVLLTPARKAMLEQAGLCGARAVVVVWDEGRTTKQGAAAEAEVLKYLYERVSMLMSGGVGMLIFDKPGGDHKDEDRWIGEHTPLFRAGTQYVANGTLVLPPITAPSHRHMHLQLADLVVGAVTAVVAGGGKYATELLPMIRPLVHTNFFGRAGGTGVKFFPDELVNLYRVVMGEGDFTKVSLAAGIGLPIDSYPYAEAANSTPIVTTVRIEEHPDPLRPQF